jgi:hypothetical protein
MGRFERGLAKVRRPAKAKAEPALRPLDAWGRCEACGLANSVIYTSGACVRCGQVPLTLDELVGMA